MASLIGCIVALRVIRDVEADWSAEKHQGKVKEFHARYLRVWHNKSPQRVNFA